MQVSQCDNCRRLGPLLPAGWLAVGTVEVPSPSLFATLLPSPAPEPCPMFCSWRCVAEYATARALISEQPAAPKELE